MPNVEYIYDTVNNYIHDTTIVIDTLILTEYVPYAVHDTITVYDTTYINVPYAVHDTVTIMDTLIVTDTLTETDTLIVTDTLWLYDTIFVHDTIIIHDTIMVGINEADGTTIKLYADRQTIVVEGAAGQRAILYDVNGRMLATKQDEYAPLRFDVPVSGTYLIKVGNLSARRIVVIR